MTLSADSPAPLSIGYLALRLVVRAQTSGRRAYVWEIIQDGPEQRLMGRSSGAFRSMEEAHADGTVALMGARRM
jgi:hypothetical protein